MFPQLSAKSSDQLAGYLGQCVGFEISNIFRLIESRHPTNSEEEMRKYVKEVNLCLCTGFVCVCACLGLCL